MLIILASSWICNQDKRNWERLAERDFKDFLTGSEHEACHYVAPLDDTRYWAKHHVWVSRFRTGGGSKRCGISVARDNQTCLVFIHVLGWQTCILSRNRSCIAWTNSKADISSYEDTFDIKDQKSSGRYEESYVWQLRRTAADIHWQMPTFKIIQKRR